MPGPTQDLINRCYAIIARCDHFHSLQSLQAVFISQELRPFRDRLRKADNLNERIRLNVAYLLYQKTADGRHAFVLFLETLRSLVGTGDALYDDIEALRNEFKQSLGQVNRIDVPYVVAAMTRTEADALQSGEVFEGTRIAQIERNRFNALTPFLPEGWIEDYGELHDDWKLHADHNSIMGTVLDEMFAQINHCLRQPQNLPVIDGISFSEPFFLPEQQIKTWEHLRQSGGLLVVDAISLFYPPIREALKQSTLTSREEMAVLVLSPLDFHVAPINSHVKNLVIEEMPMTFARFGEHLDYKYEMGIGDLCGIQRWLFTLFSNPADMAESIQKRRVDLNRMRFRKDAPPQTGRMSQTIFQQSEVG
ncbi:MAG: hypothetical protein K8R89_09355 [Anaerolineae bacterium]|nr:hypothetical protein [Anaerolineae bacterium]